MSKIWLVVAIDVIVLLVGALRFVSYLIITNYDKYEWLQKTFPIYKHRGFTPKQNKHTLALMAVCCLVLCIVGKSI